MKNRKIIIAFLSFFLIPVFTTYGHSPKIHKDVITFKVQLKLEADTAKNGHFDLKKYSDNYFTLFNESDTRLCFNEIPVFRELDFKNDIDLEKNTVFYFPQIQYFDEKNNNWELLDFYSLIGDSGEPMPMIGDSVLCLQKGSKFQFKGMFLFNTMHFQAKGKFRLCLKVYFKLNETTVILNSSNYHYFYIL